MQQNYFNNRFEPSPPKDRYRSRSPLNVQPSFYNQPSTSSSALGAPRNSYSPPKQRYSRERSENRSDNHEFWNHNPKTVIDGVVKEYIDDFTGLMEVEVQGKSQT